MGAAMGTRQRLSSNYLGVGLAVATVAAIGVISPARAQVQDLNLQTQLNILLPAPTVVTPSSTTASSPETKVASCSLPTHATESQQKALDQILHDRPNITIGEYNRDYLSKKRQISIQGVPTLPPNMNCKGGQQTTVKVSFPLNPTYETNILKIGNNSSNGESFGFGGNVLVTGPGLAGRPFDLVVVNVAEASSRYTPTFSPSVDTVNTYVAYQAFLHADGYDVDKKSGYPTSFVDSIDKSTPTVNVPQGGMTTFETLAFAIQNQTAYTPTFHTEKADFFTPQITLAGTNFDLDDSKARSCSSSIGNSFCNYANLSLTVGQSFSDVRTQQNANIAGSVTLGRRPDMTDWNLAVQATATGKDYENFVGGRSDLLLQVGPLLSYSPKPFWTDASNTEKAAISFSLPITYNKNYSTVTAAAWSGWVIMPTLTIAFTATKS
jgi:hypothetical protein